MFGLVAAVVLVLGAAGAVSKESNSFFQEDLRGLRFASVALGSVGDKGRAERSLDACDACAISVLSGGFAPGMNDVLLNSKAENTLMSLGLNVTPGDLAAPVVARYLRQNAELARNGTFFSAYRTFSEIKTYLDNLEGEFKHLMKVHRSIGKSVEGREIPVVILGKHEKKEGASDKKKPVIFFTGTQHAREWISPATVVYLIEQLVRGYGQDATVTAIIDAAEVHIVPVVNPDGYEWTFSNNRLWRKNRRHNKDGTWGVDLNRNWNTHWGGKGSSSNPSSDTYHGTGPFSEPESFAASEYVLKLKNEGHQIVGAIDWHAYSQLILRPYGWTTQLCPNENQLKALGSEIAATIKAVHGKTYQNIRSVELYITTGTAGDWYYQEGIVDSYTIELRDTGKYGFLLPPQEIVPTGQENFAGMRVFMSKALGL
jgi:murein tripeptide amidase MpaA